MRLRKERIERIREIITNVLVDKFTYTASWIIGPQQRFYAR